MVEHIGISSEVKNVRSEIDHVDAIFTVPTGPMGYQQINYHLIDEDRRTIRESLPFIQSIDESLKEKSPIQSRQTIQLIDSKVSNNSPENGN